MKKTYGGILLFILLLTFWLVLSFEVSLYIAIIGLVVSLMVVFFNYDLIFNNQELTKITIRTIISFFVLVFILLYNIIVSNIEVAKIVLSKKMPIDPGFVVIKNKLNTELNQALFANAITLTPGTLTVDMNHHEIVVHGLLRQHVKDIEGSRMEQAFLNLERVKKND